MTRSVVRPAAPPAPPSKRSVVPWLIIVGLFAVTATYIYVAVPRTDAPRAAPSATPTAHSDGLSERHDGYTLEPLALPIGRGTAIPVAFRIRGPNGSPATRYAITQSVPLHAYVAREDLSLYQHVHPRLDGDTWRTKVDVPDGGVYRLYVEFTPEERAGTLHPTLLGVRFIITGDTRYVPVPAAQATVRVGRLSVNRPDGTTTVAAGRPSALRFQVVDAGGAPVRTLEPYLGSFGHVSAFDVLTQAMVHLHPIAPAGAGPPADGTLTFHAAFPYQGAQRVFVQFQVAGTVHQAAFTVLVA
jgi:hypothetical protein